MRPQPYQIISRLIFPFKYCRLRRYISENIGHALRCPGGETEFRVSEASWHLRIQFGR